MRIGWMIVTLALATSTLYAQSDEHFLPEDMSMPIITIESAGGFRMRPKVKPEPMLSIFPDGKVVAGKTWDGVGRAEWKMDHKQVQALLKFCIDENRMHALTTESIKEDIEKTGERIMVADVPSTVIMVKTAEKTNRVEVYALSFAARQFGSLKSIQNVAAVAKRLKLIHAYTLAGGKEKFTSILKELNDKLKEEDKKAPPFSATHLNSANKTEDGTVNMNFGNAVPLLQGNPPPGSPKVSYMGNVQIMLGKKPKCSVNVFRPKQR